MKVLTYCRVSTEEQQPETQLLELRRWAEQQGHTVTCEYLDIASGARRREKLDVLEVDAEAAKPAKERSLARHH